MTLLPLNLSSLWPEGLEFVRGTISLEGAANEKFSTEKFVEALSREKIVSASGTWGTSAPIHDAVHSGFRGNLNVSKSDNEWMIQWTLNPSTEPWSDVPSGKRALGVGEFTQLLTAFVTDPGQLTLARGHFHLSKERWKSTISLPVRLPGILEGTQGRPEVAGFKFRFTEPPSELRSAEVELMSRVLLLDLTVATKFFPEQDLISRVCAALSQNVGLFAVRSPTELVSDAKS